MATVREYLEIITDASPLEKVSDAYRDLGETAVREMQAAQRSIDEAQKATQDYNSTVAQTVKQQQQAERASKDFNDEQRRGGRTLRDRIRGINILGSSLGDLVDTFRNARSEGASFGQAFKQVGEQVGGSTRFFRAARLGLAGLAVGAVAAIGKLISTSQQFKDSFDDVRAQVTAGANVFRDRLVQAGGVIRNIFDQSLGETIRGIGDAFKGIGDELRDEIALARTLERAFRDLRRESVLLDAERAAANNRIRQLKFTIDDVTAAYGERVAANREALAIERDLADREADNARERVSLLLRDVSRTGNNAALAEFLGLGQLVDNLEARTEDIINRIGSGQISDEELRQALSLGGREASDEDLEDFAAAFADLQEVQQRSIELQTEYNNSLNAINREEQDRINAILEKRAQIQQELLDAQRQITNALRESANLEGIPAIEQQRTIALEVIQSIEDTARAAFSAAGVRFDQEENFAELRRRANEEADNAIREFNFQTQRDIIAQEQAAAEAQIALLTTSGNERLTLEEFQAQERIRVQQEALQQLRQVAVDEFGEASQEVLAIEVEIAQAQRERVEGGLSAEDRVRQAALQNAELRKQIALTDVDLIEEVSDKTIDVERLKNRERLQIELDFLREKRRLLQDDPNASGLELDLLDRQIQGFEQQIANFGSINLGPLQRIKQGLLDALSIDEATLNNLAGQVGQVFNNLASGITSNIDRQISEYDRLIARLDTQIAATEDALATQLQRQADGLSNNVATLEQQLAEEQALREEATNKQIELQKRQARQQIIVDGATQASALGVAAAQLIAAEASRGLVGLVLVAGGLATLFSLFSRYKAEAAAISAQEPEFREGGQLVNGLVNGPSHERGGVRVQDRFGQTYRVEGQEFVVSREQTERYYNALDAINSGAIDQMSPGQTLALMGKRAVSDVGRKVQSGAYQLARPGIDYDELRQIQRESTKELRRTIESQSSWVEIEGKLYEVKKTKYKTSIKSRSHK